MDFLSDTLKFKQTKQVAFSSRTLIESSEKYLIPFIKIHSFKLLIWACWNFLIKFK